MNTLARHPLVHFLAVFIGYYALGQAAIRLAIMPEGIATFWPPNAVVLAALLIAPTPRWPVIVTAGIGAEFLADWGFYPLWQIVGFACVNATEAIVAATLARRLIFQSGPFKRLTIKNALWMGAIFLFVATPLAALGGGAIYALGDPSLNYWSFWRLWWFGDAIGLLIMVPFMLVWFGEPLPQPLFRRKSALEGLVVLTLVLGGGGLIFFAPQSWPDWTHAPSLMLPVLAWCVVRFGLQGATAAIVAIAFMAADGATQGLGPFIQPENAERTVLTVQEYLMISVVMVVLLGTMFRQFEQTLTALDDERLRLEERVLQRTAELDHAKQLAEERALTDSLTRLKNRRAFMQFGTQVNDQATRYGRSYAVIMLDIDVFKTINDTHGHASGDAVLVRIGELISHYVRRTDIAGRVGGEEFAICLPETDIASAEALAQRLRQAIEHTTVSCSGTDITLTASFGVAHGAGTSASLEAVMNEADQALYQAKQAGRNRVMVFAQN